MATIVIIGAGISGLSLAYFLRQRQPTWSIHLLESAARPGGKIGSHSRQNFLIEHGPNGFLDNNPSTLQLARDLGLESRLLPASETAGKNRFLLVDGRLQQLPTGFLRFLTSGMLSWRGKLNLLLERFQPRGSLPEESIDAFVRRRVGAEIAHTFADAFVTGILAGDPKLLSFQASFPRLAAMEREHGSITAGMAAARKGKPATARARMWSFPKGLQELIDALVAQLEPTLQCGVRVLGLRPEGHRWCVQLTDTELLADAVVLACPADAQAELLAPLDVSLANEIAAIPYNRVAVVALGYRRREVPHALDGFGYLTPQRERLDALGAQWCSSIFPNHRAPHEHVLIRVLSGGWNRPDLLDREDADLIRAARAQLQTALGIQAAPVFEEVVRWDRAIPQYFVGHLDRLRRIENRLACHRGLFLTGNAFRGVAINDCVERSQQLAEELLQKLTLGEAAPTS